MEQIPIPNEQRIETTSPEAELWRAVIDQAIDDLSDPDLGEGAVEWFTSVSEQPGCFRWVCQHLDLDASAVWSALINRKHRKNRVKLVERDDASKRLKPDNQRRRLRSMYSRRENRKSPAARF
jgi:hypothetical protein